MILQVGGVAAAQAVLSFFYRRVAKLESDAEVLKRSLNLLLAFVGVTVGLIITLHWEWFEPEQQKVYNVNEAIGGSYWSLSASADLVGAAYLFELIVRVTSSSLRWDLALHHSATIATVGILHNAFAFEFAPQFYASIASCLLLHVVADVPVLLIFALRGVSASKICLARSLFPVAWVKLAMHAAINVGALLLFFAGDQTFRLSDVSFAAWSKDPYNKARPSATDAMLQFDWASLLHVGLPVLVSALFLTQIWTTRVLIRVSRGRQRDSEGSGESEEPSIIKV